MDHSHCWARDEARDNPMLTTADGEAVHIAVEEAHAAREAAPTITVRGGQIADSRPPTGSSWPGFSTGLPDGIYVPVLCGCSRRAYNIRQGVALCPHCQAKSA